jgi:hypothetical protein
MVLFAAAGCGDSPHCSCPSGGCDQCGESSLAVGEVLLGPTLPAVASTSADSPCSTEYQPSAQRILVSRLGAGTCNVHVTFVDDSSDEAQVRFSKVNAPCGCILGSTAATLGPTDAGSD